MGVDIGVNPDAHQLIEIHILFFTSVHKDALDSEPDKRGWMDWVADVQVQNQNPKFLFF